MNLKIYLNPELSISSPCHNLSSALLMYSMKSLFDCFAMNWERHSFDYNCLYLSSIWNWNFIVVALYWSLILHFCILFGNYSDFESAIEYSYGLSSRSRCFRTLLFAFGRRFSIELDFSFPVRPSSCRRRSRADPNAGDSWTSHFIASSWALQISFVMKRRMSYWIRRSYFVIGQSFSVEGDFVFHFFDCVLNFEQLLSSYFHLPILRSAKCHRLSFLRLYWYCLDGRSFYR